MSTDRALYDWMMDLRWRDLSPEVQRFSRRCLLDLSGVLVSGTQTKLAQIISEYAVVAHGGAAARLPLDGRTLSETGAALALGMTIDAVDAHDGARPTKGHAGCGAIAALLAYSEGRDLDDMEAFLTALVVGYEIAIRAGVALHATAPDYHTSGAWVALACAAMGCKLDGASFECFQHALGIAEYHGPRSQMMRCIDHPTMLKDGSGWGAMAGVSAYQLAAAGFTGAPAITVTEAGEHWLDLGRRWLMLEQYFKPYPVCRWAQPAVQAVLELREAYAIKGAEILRIDVETFHEGCRLAAVHPEDTEQAQYSLPWPVAVAAIHGTVGVEHITDSYLQDEELRDLAGEIYMRESDRFNAVFPGQRLAQVTITQFSGRQFTSDVVQATGDPETPLSDEEIEAKFFGLCGPVISKPRSDAIHQAVFGGSVRTLRQALFSAVAPAMGPG